MLVLSSQQVYAIVELLDVLRFGVWHVEGELKRLEAMDGQASIALIADDFYRRLALLLLAIGVLERAVAALEFPAYFTCHVHHLH